MMQDAVITINGKVLTIGQSTALTAAISAFAFQFHDKTFRESLGDMAVNYELRIKEVLHLLEDTPA